MSKKEKEILKETPVTEAPAQEPEVVIDVKNLSVGLKRTSFGFKKRPALDAGKSFIRTA